MFICLLKTNWRQKQLNYEIDLRKYVFKNKDDNRIELQAINI